MDLLSLILATALALGSSGSVATSSTVNDPGTTTSSETEPTDTTEARSHIIDLG